MRILNLALIIAILGLITLNLRSCLKSNQLEKELKQSAEQSAKTKKAIETEAKIISRKVDQFGAEHVTIDAKENIFPRSVLTNSVAVSPGILDTTAMALKVQKKQIESLLVVNSTLKAENLKAERRLDSLKNEYFSYSDKFVTLKFKPADSVNNSAATFDFTYNASLNTVQYYKRKFPIIGAKQSFTDIWSNDSRTTINGVKRFSVAQKEPEFGLRLQLRTIYGLTSRKFYAGPGVSFDFKRFNFLGYTYYNYTDERWQNVVGINYDLIRF